MNILAVDPGLNNIGVTVYDLDTNTIVVNTELKCSKDTIQNKLVKIYTYFKNIFDNYNIQKIVYEDPVFIQRGDIGQKINFSLGLIVLFAGMYKSEIYHYSAKQIKKTVTGNGNADKELVAKNCILYFQLDETTIFTSDHASDSLAILITYLKSKQ
jgi:crossover junction endodeoxyribonuclease RuvC